MIEHMGQGPGAAGVGDGPPGPAQHSTCEEKVKSALYDPPKEINLHCGSRSCCSGLVLCC